MNKINVVTENKKLEVMNKVIDVIIEGFSQEASQLDFIADFLEETKESLEPILKIKMKD
ncbi:hypothetical protein N4T77_02830 [Clostridium sp. CX1]|uniref:hypothetical protein n=1 Tax=Clostridium sp. CX1 TaxID=2978346 RepID=UPI0021BF619B|nr:hypothetical protein [Clostridium sp. CX1]MCT8975526.1 hypothetical protein [Clostridium sp. CX1]